jgi:glutathione S-transferase
MKLFYKAGTCSLAPHIVMTELNMVFETESVDLATKQCVSGDFRKINPKGSVPALRMDNGEILTEGSIISQYLADQKMDSGLIPKYGTLERYRCLEMMNFIATEVHKSFSPLFGADRIVKNVEGKTEMKMYYVEALKTKVALVSEKLGSNDFLMGKQFTIADAYLFTVLGWSKHVGLDLSAWSNVTSYMNRVSERPAVMKAMKVEGLI